MPRELINTGSDKRYVRRNAKGEFKDVVDVGRSLAADRRSKSKTVVKAGDGDRGDQKPRKKATAKRAPAKRATARKAAPKKAASSRAKAKATAPPRSKAKTLSKARGAKKR